MSPGRRSPEQFAWNELQDPRHETMGNRVLFRKRIPTLPIVPVRNQTAPAPRLRAFHGRPGLDFARPLRQHEAPSHDLPYRVNTEQLNFEKALEELETLVEQLERGELTLEQSLERFERGVQLTRRCQQALQQAEQRVMALTQPSAEAPLAPFEPDSAG